MSEIKLTADGGGGSVSFKGPATTTSNAAVQLTLPVDDGTANQYLKTDGSGALSWATVDTSIADDSIVEAKLDVSNAPTNGHFLQAQSGEGGGLTWAAASGVKQIVQTTADQTYSNSTDSGALWDVSGTLKRDITTTSDSSKVLVFMNITLGIEEGVGSDVAVQVTRQDGGSGSFDLIAGANGATAGNRTRVHTMCNVGNDPNNTWRGSAATVCYLDAPGNAGTYSYSFKLCHSIGSTETLYINRTEDDTDAAWTQRGLSNIICAEFY